MWVEVCIVYAMYTLLLAVGIWLLKFPMVHPHATYTFGDSLKFAAVIMAIDVLIAWVWWRAERNRENHGMRIGLMLLGCLALCFCVKNPRKVPLIQPFVSMYPCDIHGKPVKNH